MKRIFVLILLLCMALAALGGDFWKSKLPRQACRAIILIGEAEESIEKAISENQDSVRYALGQLLDKFALFSGE